MWVRGPLDRGFDQSGDSRQSDREASSRREVFQAPLPPRQFGRGRNHVDRGCNAAETRASWATSAREHRPDSIGRSPYLPHPAGHATPAAAPTEPRQRSGHRSRPQLQESEGPIGWVIRWQTSRENQPGDTKAHRLCTRKRAQPQAAGLVIAAVACSRALVPIASRIYAVIQSIENEGLRARWTGFCLIVGGSTESDKAPRPPQLFRYGTPALVSSK